MENSILIGNGFNHLMGEDYLSWEQLITSPLNPPSSTLNPQSSFPFRFEVAVALASRENSTTCRAEEESRKRDIQRILKEKVDSILANPTSQGVSLYEAISELPFTDYLTTNYDNFLVRYFKNCKKYKSAGKDRSEDQFSIQRRYDFVKKDRKVSIWNIHGDVDKMESMIVGFDHYCKNVWKLNEYLKGSNYKYKDSKGENQILDKGIVARLLDPNRTFDSYDIRTWCDNFFLRNVHIIGMSLRFDEIDIWWLLVLHSRLVSNPNLQSNISNKIYYYDIEPHPEKHQALRAFGVEVVLADQSLILRDSQGAITNWHTLYLHLLEKMRSLISAESC